MELDRRVTMSFCRLAAFQVIAARRFFFLAGNCDWERPTAVSIQGAATPY